jgi:hypothetical protein
VSPGCVDLTFLSPCASLDNGIGCSEIIERDKERQKKRQRQHLEQFPPSTSISSVLVATHSPNSSESFLSKHRCVWGRTSRVCCTHFLTECTMCLHHKTKPNVRLHPHPHRLGTLEGSSAFSSPQLNSSISLSERQWQQQQEQHQLQQRQQPNRDIPQPRLIKSPSKSRSSPSAGGYLSPSQRWSNQHRSRR